MCVCVCVCLCVCLYIYNIHIHMSANLTSLILVPALILVVGDLERLDGLADISFGSLHLRAVRAQRAWPRAWQVARPAGSRKHGEGRATSR